MHVDRLTPFSVCRSLSCWDVLHRIILCLRNALLSAFLAGSVAHAEAPGVTIVSNPVVFLESDKQPAPMHSAVQKDGTTVYINQEDCTRDRQIRFAIALTNPSSQYVLETWAGAGCDQWRNRSQPNPTCWKVMEKPLPRSSPQEKIDLRVQDLVQFLGRTPAQLEYMRGTEEVCAKQKSGPLQLTVWFLWLNPATLETVGKTSFTLPAVLRGPSPPDDDDISVSEGRILHAQFKPAEITTDDIVQGYVAYCMEAPACTGTLSDFGINSGDASKVSEGSLPSTLRCETKIERAPTSLKLKTKPLGVQQAVAVAALDVYGNIGPLSKVFCATPVEVEDFWTRYQRNGGEATGCQCHLGGAGNTGSTLLEGCMMLLMIGLGRKRVRRKR